MACIAEMIVKLTPTLPNELAANLSVLRVFRLLRLFRLARAWRSLHVRDRQGEAGRQGGRERGRGRETERQIGGVRMRARVWGVCGARATVLYLLRHESWRGAGLGLMAWGCRVKRLPLPLLHSLPVSIRWVWRFSHNTPATRHTDTHTYTHHPPYTAVQAICLTLLKSIKATLYLTLLLL